MGAVGAFAAPLHVVVLAAGTGSRLAGPERRPKWLTPVAGRTIAQEQLSGLDALPVAHHLDVVTGHAHDLVERAVAARPGTGVVHNPEYAELNNWWSVLRALRHRRRTGRTGTLVILNSDLWAPADWFTSAIHALACQPGPAMLVDTRRPLTDEAMKVAASHGLATAIGKTGVQDPVGEYTGALSLPASALPLLEKALESFVGDRDRDSAWYEHAVSVTFDLGLTWSLVEPASESWVEIDDAHDLARAEELSGR